MGLNNSESSSNDILDKALDDLIKDENARDTDGRNVSSDELINAIFDDEDLAKESESKSLPTSPGSQEMDSLSNETGDILDEALGAPKEEPVTLLDDEFFSSGAGIDAMLDGTGEMLPTDETDKSFDDKADESSDAELDALLDTTDTAQTSTENNGGLDAMLTGPDLSNDQDSDDELDALLDEPTTTEASSEADDDSDDGLDAMLTGPDLSNDQVSDDELDALLDEPSTTESTTEADDDSDDGLDAMLTGPDLSNDEPSDDKVDALLDEPDTTETSTEGDDDSDDGLDAMLNGPDQSNDEPSDDKMDALLDEPDTTETSIEGDDDSDDGLDAMLNGPDQSNDEPSDDKMDALLDEPDTTETSIEGDDDSDDGLDAMLNGPDLSKDVSSDDELDALLDEPATAEASTEEDDGEGEDGIDAMLNGPDLTDTEDDGENSSLVDAGSESSVDNESVDVSDLLSEFGDDESNSINNEHEQRDYLDLDNLDGVASAFDEKEPQAPDIDSKLRGASEFESMLDSAAEIENEGESSTKSDAEINVAQSPTEMDATKDSKFEKGTESEMKTTKGSLALIIAATLFSGAAGLAGGIFGPSLMHEFGVKTPGSDASQLISNDVIALKQDLTALKSEVKDVTASNSNAIVRLREDVNSVKSGQQDLTEKHATVTANISNLESGMGQFEIELVKRVEALLTLVEKATDSNRAMSSDVKETVLREIVQLIEEGGINGVSAQMAKALEEFKNKANEVSQLQDMVTGLRNLTTMTNAEMKYLSSRLGKLEQQPSTQYFTPPEVDTEKEPQQEIKKPVSVYVDTEKKDVKHEPKKVESSEKSSVQPKQFVLGVHEVKRGEYIIYLQREGDSDTQFKPYRFSKSQAPVVPGYGRITGVSKVTDPTLMIEHVVSTEGGLITGKKRSGGF